MLFRGGLIFLADSFALAAVMLGASICGGNNAFAMLRPRLTLAVKFIEFAPHSESDGPALTRGQADKVIETINQEYAQCGLSLVLGDYEKIDPATIGLPYRLDSMSELESVRQAFNDPRYLVVIDTGPWNHARMGSANAWTAMPGDQPSGAVLEGPVASDAPVLAHELGHYLGLEHISDLTDMMNPVIYSNSTLILSDQCQQMLHTAQADRSLALR